MVVVMETTLYLRMYFDSLLAAVNKLGEKMKNRDTKIPSSQHEKMWASLLAVSLLCSATLANVSDLRLSGIVVVLSKLHNHTYS